MITINTGEKYPEGEFDIFHNEDGTISFFGKEDQKTKDEDIERYKVLVGSSLIKQKEKEINLIKKQYDLDYLRDAVIAEIAVGSLTVKETKALFVKAIVLIGESNNKMNDKNFQIKSAKTKEDLTTIGALRE